MNEQELADLFSDQLDRMLHGESTTVPPGTGDLQDLLDIVEPSTQTQFQASSAAQATFASQLANWFGLGNGGSPMTVLGLSKAWFIGIIVTIVTVIGGAGLIAVITTTVLVFDSSGDAPVAATDVSTETPEATDTPDMESTPEMTATTTTPEMTTTPSMTGTVPATTTVTPEPPTAGFPTLIITNQLIVTSLCQGAYVTQSTLVNYGSVPVTDAALVWEVIEGAEFVDDVELASDDFRQESDDDELADDDYASVDDDMASASTDSETPSVAQAGFANFSQIAVDQEVELDIAVDVDDGWWEQPDGTEIKIKLSVENKIEISSDDDDDGDLDRGHGNDPDGFDEDNPGRGHRQDDDDGDSDLSGHSQIITIVKQGAEWVILDGFLHDHGEQTFLVSGTVVVINDCTGLPPQMPIGSEVKIVGQLLPDGTFLAINIIVIDVDVTIDFDSGVSGGGSDDDDDGGSGGGGGSPGGSGGSRGGSGGSRGGSGGSGGS